MDMDDHSGTFCRMDKFPILKSVNEELENKYTQLPNFKSTKIIIKNETSHKCSQMHYRIENKKDTMKIMQFCRRFRKAVGVYFLIKIEMKIMYIFYYNQSQCIVQQRWHK